jgi:hypothetical protein
MVEFQRSLEALAWAKDADLQRRRGSAQGTMEG